MKTIKEFWRYLLEAFGITQNEAYGAVPMKGLASVSATIIRADGTVEEVGVLDEGQPVEYRVLGKGRIEVSDQGGNVIVLEDDQLKET